MSLYTLHSCIPGHRASINALAFSPDGKYLASGADDGIMFVFEIESGSELHKLAGVNAVTALLWSTRNLYAGFGDGRVLSAEVTPHKLSAVYFPRKEQGIVESIASDPSGEQVVVCVGPKVEIWRHVELERMSCRSLPSPISAAEPGPTDIPRKNRLVSREPTPSPQEYPKPRAAHFTENGHGLLVGYLNHGIYYWDMDTETFLWHIETHVGRLSLSPDKDVVAVSNLYDGFDIYRLSDQAHVRTFPTNTEVNLPLPVLVIDGGKALFMGTSCGQVRIMNLRTGEEIQGLGHDADDIVQALAYYGHPTQDACLLATGTSERGPDTRIRVWRSSGPTRVDVAVGTDQDVERIAPPGVTAHAQRPISPWFLACISFLSGALPLLIVAVYRLPVRRLDVHAWEYMLYAQELLLSMQAAAIELSVSAARWASMTLERYIDHMGERS